MEVPGGEKNDPPSLAYNFLDHAILQSTQLAAPCSARVLLHTKAHIHATPLLAAHAGAC